MKLLMQCEVISSGNILLTDPKLEPPLFVSMNSHTLYCYCRVENIFIGNFVRSTLDHMLFTAGNL